VKERRLLAVAVTLSGVSFAGAVSLDGDADPLVDELAESVA